MHKLTKISNNSGGLRTNEVIGELQLGPIVGLPFIIWAKSIDPNKDYREVATSLVTKIEGNEFHTQNSIYRLEELSE